MMTLNNFGRHGIAAMQSARGDAARLRLKALSSSTPVENLNRQRASNSNISIPALRLTNGVSEEHSTLPTLHTSIVSYGGCRIKAQFENQSSKGHGSRVAERREDAGRYESARQALGELWQRIGEQPNIEGLQPSIAGEVLLRAGVLTGWIGSCNQIPEAQETAKNLISQALNIFESLSYGKKILEAQTELALCYWRESRYSEARFILKNVLARLKQDSELKAKAILRSAIVEYSAACYLSNTLSPHYQRNLREIDERADIDSHGEAAEILLAATLLAAGFHTHHRQWRRTRHG